MKLTLCLFVILCLVSFINGGYIVTTPRKWVSGQASQVCVILPFPATSEEALNVAIIEDTSKKEFILNPKDLPLPEGKRNICNQVLLPDTKATRATLLISGSLGGVTLNESRAINIVADVAETFVQTDKFVYKAQQTVQFRILTVIGPYLNISLDQYDEIWIENPSGSRIAQWLNVPNENGLIHMSFALSDEPEQGKYQIRVRTPFGKTKYQTFKVEEYVLPRYEVVIKPPSYVLGISDTVTFKICAKYTFGQPVKGNVTLIVDNNGWSNYKVVVKKEGNIRGCKKFILNSTELSINGDHYLAYSLNANANVTEEGTGVQLRAKKVSVDITRAALNFKDISVQKYYKPEVPYIGEIRVTQPDERPAPNELINVCCGKICQNLTTNANGILKFAVPPHLEESIRVKSVNFPQIKLGNFSYKSIMYESSFWKSMTKYHSPSNSSLVIAISSDEIECSAAKEAIDLKLPVQFAAVKQSSATITVQVISRGQIQLSKTFEQFLNASGSFHMDESLLLEPLKEPATKDLIRGHFTISISLPKTISPEAQIIIWYTRSDEEVVSDVRKLDVTECLLNPVYMDWSSDIVRPGDQATLSLQAEPFSFCSLGVVDKSVHLLSSKKSALTFKSLLKLTGKSSVGKYENLQVDDFEYCKGKFTEEPSSTESPPLLPPIALPLRERMEGNSETGETPNLEEEVLQRRKKRSFMSNHPHWSFYSSDVDALHMFDEAGIYIISDLILESRPCKKLYEYTTTTPTPVVIATTWYSTTTQLSWVPDVVEGLLEQPTDVPTSTSRTYFPETFLWNAHFVSEMGVREENVTLPDTVTEWVGSAVCVHPTKGVGLSLSSSITTFRDFFVDLTLPPSAKRGEIFPVKISVFNYLKEPLPVKVILEESSQYDILADNCEDLGSGERMSCLLSQDKSVHAIRIRPKEIGNINLTVSAFIDTNSIATCSYISDEDRTDVLVKSFLVEIEGVPKEKTWSKYICVEDLESSEDAFETWMIQTPTSIIPDSARGFVTVVGDLMGPTLENLGSLVKMPYGCGEQNMLNFAPNIFVMQYLDSSKQNSVEIAERAIQFMKKGYQRELNYRHRDGSFSAFGESDDSGSTWLTAFVLKSFAQARDYIAVDSVDLDISRMWLKRRQLENGCFESVGKFLHKGMKGGLQNSDSPVLLSSFVLIALMEAGEGDASTSVREALFCLGADETTKNPYSLAVKAYALALAGSPDARSVIDSLLELATIGGSTLHWELPEGYETSKGVGVETAGYVVLALLAHGMKLETDFTNVKKIIKWMNNQRNGQGGFVSTQDTIVALQALAQFEKSIPQGEIDAHVIVQTTDLESVITVNGQNKLLLQKTDLVTVPTTVNVHISGAGCVLVQAILRYNIPDAETSEAFSLRVNATTEVDNACKTKRITACASYLLPDQKSNMAIMEMNLVSGYIPDKSDLKRIVGYGTGLFKRYEVDGSVVTIYVDEFSREEICVSLRIMREVQVENPKPGFVKVYDYYKPEFFATMKYELPPATECLEESVVEFLPFEEDIVIITPSTENLGEMLDAFDEAIA